MLLSQYNLITVAFVQTIIISTELCHSYTSSTTPSLPIPFKNMRTEFVYKRDLLLQGTTHSITIWTVKHFQAKMTVFEGKSILGLFNELRAVLRWSMVKERLLLLCLNILLTLTMELPLTAEDKHDCDDTSSPSPQKPCAFAGNYLLLRKIQRGGQACIYFAQKEDNYFALKVYPEGDAHLKAFQNEVAILNKLQCRGLVPIAETAHHVPLAVDGEQPTTAHIIAMPFIENGDLFEWVCKHGCLTEGVARYFGKKLLETLRYLHSQHVIHRDLKPENILLDAHYEPLLLDFGLSIDSRHRALNFVGDIRYAAPEVVKHIEHTEKSEIYSFGILLFYLLTSQCPFLHAKVSDPNYRLLVERKPLIFWQKVEAKLKRELSSSFKELFMQIVSPQPANRPNFDEILQSSWFCEKQPTREQYQLSFRGRSEM